MVYLRKTGLNFFVLILVLMCSSCMLMKEAPSPKVKTTPHPQASVQAPDQVRQNSATGQSNQVLDSYKTEIDKAPQNQDLFKDYAKSLESMNTAAEKAYSRQDFAAACKTYHLLLKRYPDFKNATHLLSFNRTQLSSRLTDCKTALYQKGFQEYREGNLMKAIATWQDYLEIDPDNATIKKALSTAKAQEKNLRDN